MSGTCDRNGESLTNRPFLSVYVADIPADLEIRPVFHSEREEQLNATVNPKLKAERYAVWKVLEAAVQHSLGTDVTPETVCKASTGKWLLKNGFISLTHTEGAVAAAVSDSAVGVDLENLTLRREKNPNYPQKLGARIRTAAETEADREDPSDERFYARWTRKESLFKAGDGMSSDPQKLETALRAAFTEVRPEAMKTIQPELQLRTFVCSGTPKLMLSLAGESRAELHIYSVDLREMTGGSGEAGDENTADTANEFAAAVEKIAAAIRMFSTEEWKEITDL